MHAMSLLNVSNPSWLRSYRLNQADFCHFNAGHSSLSWRSHAQFSENFKHTLLKQRKGHFRSFAFNIKDVFTNDICTEKDVEQTIHGEAVVQKQKVSLFNVRDFCATTLADEASELIGNRVYIHLVSDHQVDPDTAMDKKSSEASYLKWNRRGKPISGEIHYEITFKWNSSLGVPGALLIKNMHSREFFLKSLTLDIPGREKLRFNCNSWISPYSTSKSDRIFFSNKSYLPEATPTGLKELREQDMVELRGDGKGERKVWDRIYDYDVYNDLGDPDHNPELVREVLGGSKNFPYPRRCRMGRPPTKTDPKFESRVDFPNVIYIPRDETIPDTDFVAQTLMGLANLITLTISGLLETFKQIEHPYSPGFRSPNDSDKSLLQHKSPQVLKANEHASKNDKEFARPVLVGVNPMMLKCLQTFPPYSSLEPNVYGPQQSSITDQNIEKFIEGLSVAQAVASKRLFILDYYDVYMLYAERINQQSDEIKTYASRTLFFLSNDGVLKPVAIELCLPPIADHKAVRNVYTPAEDGTEQEALWRMAKEHVIVNDSCYDQMISHWLRTHASMEPFIIATHRQLSRMHPLYKLLIPHYFNTMHINQTTRQNLINARGIIERSYIPGKYFTEMISTMYKEWRFNQQGLPADLLKRGMAVPDPTAPHGLRLVIEDYPYAVDGLEIWSAVKDWVLDFLSLFYKNDASIKRDQELQAWWSEIVNVGHEDLKDDPSRWYKMETKEEVVEAITTIIWLTSGYHAVVNPSQGFSLPTMSRRLIPDKGSEEYSEMLNDIEAYVLESVPAPAQPPQAMQGFLKMLTQHGQKDVYLGQLHGSTPEWADDNGIAEAFNRFSSRLVQVEKNVIARNNNPNLKNRHGYTLLYPNTRDLSKSGGVTGHGVPNSISR